jgi:hypothetical protein
MKWFGKEPIGKDGFPVEFIKGRPILNFFRLLIHTNHDRTMTGALVGWPYSYARYWPLFIQVPVPGDPGNPLTAERTKFCFHTARYVCQACSFTASFDPRDMPPDSAKHLFLLHFNESHSNVLGAKHA